MSILLGCIADDLTGASDLASFLVSAGMRTVQFVGIPDDSMRVDEVDAVVISLKSRSLPAPEAVESSLLALEWLMKQPCEQFYFKYCSTFDSTPRGNIGPVLDALMARLETSFTIACPALPINGRTQYQGYLFVQGRLLNESGMEQHPLTPMTDANLVRVLAAQSQGPVDLVDITTVRRGSAAVRERFDELAGTDCRYALVDALEQEDLVTIAHACGGLKLVSGGSGLATGLASHLASEGRLNRDIDSATLDAVPGDTVILAGSCSRATLEQVEVFKAVHPSLKLDPLALQEQRQSVAQILDWFDRHRHQSPLMIYASDHPDAIRASQAQLGIATASSLVEETLAAVAHELVRLGVHKFVVAGGETSGAVVKALETRGFRIGRSIAPGVPLMQTLDGTPRLVALKSGNFGGPDFFLSAVEVMQ
ncbi:3-oxo-tetronate kinase [Marinobacterium aestuariivivens]|uniref:3-oxo-tetronate kinase n=1 Tax=Marinobacterium aestuariivivens TaxID=1698799 RepID=A0ABW2A0Z9_9GAMM